MKTKMSILWVAVGLSSAGCKRPYYPAGGSGPLNVAGSYEMSESIYSNSCGPGIVARKGPLHVRVEHTPGAGFAKIIVEDRFLYDATIRSDGNFVVAQPLGSDQRSALSRTISGNFTKSAMFARVMVDTIRPLPPTNRPLAAVDQAERNCKYQLRWEAKKL